MKSATIFLALLPTFGVLASPAKLSSRALEERQAGAAYWYESYISSALQYGPNPSYVVQRNVKTFGAKGDGVTDDTAAIQAAISGGGRCAPGSCKSSTTTPAVVYFPAGTYRITSPLILYYFTQMIGNPNAMPVIKADPSFKGVWMVDGDQYQDGGVLGFDAVNLFMRQMKNFVIDTTAVPISNPLTGVHWPGSQATSMQNVIFKMSAASGTQHQGIFIEKGSGGVMTDLVFYGGKYGAQLGNQQYYMRNWTINNAVTAINQFWNWGFTWKGLTINNCQIGLNMANYGDDGTPSVGGAVVLDSSITNTPVAFTTVVDNSRGGGLVLENVAIKNVPLIVRGPNGESYYKGTTGSLTVGAWGNGHAYTPTGPNNITGTFTPVKRPAGLITSSGKYYERSKPSYAGITSYNRVRKTFGAKGDGKTDDTTAIQNALTNSVKSGLPLFFEAGTYLVSSTLYVPAGSKIFGESFPRIIAQGSYFGNANSPQPVVKVGNKGESGVVEWSDMMVSTRGSNPGAILIQWNLASPAATPSGIWDVHTQVGGFAGSNLQLAQCAAKSGTASVYVAACHAAFMLMHISTTGTGLYVENSWLWTSDHDLDDNSQGQISIFAGRGLLIESSVGNIWLAGVAAEHNALYQFQLQGTKNIYMGQIQTETPYYQPYPAVPIAPVAGWNDPDNLAYCSSQGRASNSGCANAMALRVNNSKTVDIYGAGLYSFFNSYSTSCSNKGTATCQLGLMNVLGSSRDVNAYVVNGIGGERIISMNNTNAASYVKNKGVYPGCVSVYKLT